MKVFVFSDIDTFGAFLIDARINYVYIWNHSWIFIEDPNKRDVLYGFHFEDNGEYRKWRDELTQSDLVAFDIEHLFLIANAEDLTKLLLAKAEA